MAEPARPEVRYTAFLSYSHKDAAAAGRLHRRLEAYRLPKRLAGSETARGIVPERLWPIFRDREELPAATDLSETVREALAQSGALIVLCSPHSTGSLWVAEEIETFRRLHPDRPVLAAILDGDPPDCFPGALRALDKDGARHEPLATDLRRGRDGAQLGLLKLVAGVTGVGLDALVQRDAARRVRQITAIMTVAVIAMFMMAALAWFAIDARREAERQRVEAEGLIEFMQTDLRYRLTGVGRLDIMYDVNLQALRYYERQAAAHRRPADSARLERVNLAIGEVQLARGNRSAARATFHDANEHILSLARRWPDSVDVIFARAQGEYWIGYMGYLDGDRSVAKTSWTRYEALTARLLSIDRSNPRWLREAGFAQGNLCTLAMMPPAEPALALVRCQAALDRMDQARLLQPANLQIIQDLANRHGWMVNVMSANGRWDRAKSHIVQYEALLNALIRRDPANIDYRDMSMRSHFGFAAQLTEHGERVEARRRLLAASQTAEFLLARDPENAEWRVWRQRIASQLR